MSGIKVASAQSHSFHGGALSFMSCTSGRESLPLESENESSQPAECKAETKKKKFHPLRNLRRMFRRKARRSSISADAYQVVVPDNPEIPSVNLEQRSCSTSRLQDDNSTQPFINGNNVNNNRLNPGLSLSHDSIFTPERADSGLSSSDFGNSSLSITVLSPPSRESAFKSQQSSCSETSLLSLGSSEVDELSPVRNRKISDLDLGITTYKLSHSAAKHKMAVRPKRNHGAPRTRRKPMISILPLPTTIEVNEEKCLGQSSPSGEVEFIWPGVETNNREERSARSEDEHQSEKEEETSTGQRTDSFFGRFLSRRSEKKKKNVRPSQGEEVTEGRAGSLGKRFSKRGKSPHHRQRVEPVEIPATTVPVPVNDSKDEKEFSNSGSPPRCGRWITQAISFSMSPPKAGWNEEMDVDAKDGKEIRRSPSEKLTKDSRNPNFMKELTTSIGLFGKDESGKRKKEEGEENDDEESVLKVQKENSDTERTIILVEGEVERADTQKTTAKQETKYIDMVTIRVNHTTKEEILAVSYDNTINDGYKSIGLIEKVKHEKAPKEKSIKGSRASEAKETVEVVEVSRVTSVDDKAPNEKRVEGKPTGNDSESVKKLEREVVRRVKPAVSQKPKDLKRFGNAGYVKTVTGATTETDENPERRGEGKPIAKLVERRKSELMLVSDVGGEGGEPRAREPGCTPEGAPSREPEAAPDAVVLRKKAPAGSADDQPELMKVFARRSLKVREAETKLGEERHRSMDSDKENEDSIPKEERKKSFEEGGATGNQVNVIDPRPLFESDGSSQRYGRSLCTKDEPESEPEMKPAVLEENKMRKSEKAGYHVTNGEKEPEERGEGEGPAFKKIQQRTAEWERRAQRSAN